MNRTINDDNEEDRWRKPNNNQPTRKMDGRAEATTARRIGGRAKASTRRRMDGQADTTTRRMLWVGEDKEEDGRTGQGNDIKDGRGGRRRRC